MNQRRKPHLRALIACILAVLLFASTVLPAMAVSFDLDGNGDHNISDVTVLLNFLKDGNDYDAAYDLNQDGSVNITDVTTLLNALATGIFPEDPEEQTVSKTWTLTFPGGNEKSNTNYTSEWNATIDGQTWTLFAINNGGDSSNGWEIVRAGRKSDASVATVTTTMTEGTVQSIVLNLTQVNAAKTNSIKLYVKDGETTLATVEIDSVSVGEHTFEVPAAVQAAGLTYELEFDLQADGSNNGFTRFDSVTYSGFVPVTDPGTCTHNYGTPTYEWAADHSTCTATATCSLCDDTVTETVNAVTTTGEGSITYTATFTNALFTEQTYTEQTGTQTGTSWTLTFPDYNDTNVGSYTMEWTATVGTQVWTLTNFNNNQSGWAYVKCGAKNKSGEATITTTIDGTVAEFVLSASKMGYATGLTLTVKNGDTTVTTINGSTEAGDQTIVIPEQYRGTGYTYVLTFSYENTSSSNGSIWVESVTANGESGGTVDPGECTHAYGTPTYEWAADHATCTATAVCSLCSDTVTETVTAVTTTGESSVTYTATFTNALFAAQTYTEQTSSATTLTLTFPDYNDEGVGAYTKTWTATVGTQVWTRANFNNNQSGWAYVKCGSKNSESVGTITTDVDGKVLTVAVTIDQLTAAKVNSIKLIVTSGSDSNTYTLNAASGTQTVTILAADQFDSATYTLEFDCAQGTSNGIVVVSKVEITLGDGDTTGTSPDAPCTHTYGTPTYEWANDHATCTASAVCSLCGDTVTETVNATSVAGENSTTYTATFTNALFTEQTETVTSAVESTMEDIVNNAYNLDTGASTSETKTLTGVVTNVTEVSTQYGNATFDFVVGTLTDKPIKAYRVYPADGVDMSGIVLNATVTVTGYIKNYNGTIEFCTVNNVRATIDAITAPQITDLEKATAELNAVTFGASVATGAEITVPVAGTTYTDVELAWEVSDDMGVQIDDTLLFEEVDTDTEVTVTVYAMIGNEMISKDFTVTVLASGSSSEQGEAKTWTLTFPSGNSGANTSYTGSFSATLDGQTWDLYGFNNGGSGTSAWSIIRTGSKNAALVSTISTTIDGTVENVVLKLTQVNASKTNSIKLYIYNGTALVTSIEIDSVTVGEHTFTIPAASQAAGLTYTLKFDLQQDSSNGTTRVESVVYNGFAGGSAFDPGDAPETVVVTNAEYPTLDSFGDDYPNLVPGVTSTGNVEVLVIPVGFTNSSSSYNNNTTVKAKLEKAFNGTSADTGWHSLSSYYSTVSYGALNIHATITDIYQTDTAYDLTSGECGVDDDNYLKSALSYFNNSYNYANFDHDNDGTIDCVYLVYLAPYGTANNHTDLWWAYTTVYQGDSVTYDGKEPFWYMWFSIEFFDEPIYNDGDVTDTLGVTINCETVIHETGHALGLDDYYDYVNGSQPGLGGLVMMDWNQGDHDPYSKAILGWINPTILKAGEYDTTLSSYTTTGDALFIARNGNNSLFDEFYIVTYYTPDGVNALKAQNSTTLGYDFGVLSQAGILIYHVNSTLESDLSDVLLYDICAQDNGQTTDRLIKVVEKEACVEDGYAADSAYVLFGEGDSIQIVWNDGTGSYLTIVIGDIANGEAEISVVWG